MKFSTATVALMGYAASAMGLEMCLHRESTCSKFSENCFTPVLGVCQKFPQNMISMELYYHAEEVNGTLIVKGYTADNKKCEGESLVPAVSLPINQCVLTKVDELALPFWINVTGNSKTTSTSSTSTSPSSNGTTNSGVSLTPRIVASALAMVVAMLL